MKELILCKGRELHEVFKDKNGEYLRLGDEFFMKGKKHKLIEYQGKMKIFPISEKWGFYTHPYNYSHFEDLGEKAEKIIK